jgi:hypothetical protein
MVMLAVVVVASATGIAFDGGTTRGATAGTSGDPAIDPTPDRDGGAGYDRKHDPKAAKDPSRASGGERGHETQNPASGRTTIEPPTGSAKESGPGSGEGM